MGEKLRLPGKIGDAATGGAMLPAGQYAFQVTKATIQKGSDAPYLRVHMKCISEGPFFGTEPFPDQLSTADTAFWKIASFLKALDAPDDVNVVDVDDLKGQKYICTVVQEDYQNSPRNKYLNYMKYSEEAAKSIGAGAGVGVEEKSKAKADEPVAAKWGTGKK